VPRAPSPDLPAPTPSAHEGTPRGRDLGKQCPPLYPLQFDARGFEDTPRAPWPNGFFQGFAYLADQVRYGEQFLFEVHIEFGKFKGDASGLAFE